MTAQSELHTLAVKVGEISGQLRELDVLPNSPFANIVGVRGGNSKLFAERNASQRGCSDFDNVRLSQYRMGSGRPARRVAPPFRRRVNHVDCLGAPKKMGGIAARRIVAPVKGPVFCARARIARKNERDVSSLHNPFRMEAEISVSPRASVCVPRPAFIWSAPINLFPKTGFGAFGNIIYGEHSHRALHSHCGQDRAALARCSGPISLTDSRFVRKCEGAL